MAKKEEDNCKTPLSTREKITIYLCFLIIRIVKPTNYSHDLDVIEDTIFTEIKNKK